jgi:hypothetical protein
MSAEKSKHDTFDGPCACGAWHTPNEWVLKSSIPTPTRTLPPAPVVEGDDVAIWAKELGEAKNTSINAGLQDLVRDFQKWCKANAARQGGGR